MKCQDRRLQMVTSKIASCRLKFELAKDMVGLSITTWDRKMDNIIEMHKTTAPIFTPADRLALLKFLHRHEWGGMDDILVDTDDEGKLAGYIAQIKGTASEKMHIGEDGDYDFLIGLNPDHDEKIKGSKPFLRSEYPTRDKLFVDRELARRVVAALKDFLSY